MHLSTKPKSVEFSLMKDLVRSNKININNNTQYEEIDYSLDSTSNSNNEEERKYWSLLHQLLSNDINKVNSENGKASMVYSSVLNTEDVLISREQELQNKLAGLEKDSVQYRNIMLNYRIESVGGMGTRDAVVAAAKYLSEEENIPYFWGGKYLKLGVNEDWNNMAPIPSKGSDVQFEGTNWPLGLDCSGFVTWAIINGGYKLEASYTGAYLDIIKPISYNYNVDNLKSGNIKEGDLLFRPGHISIITDIDIDNNTIKVAEEKGAKYGMVVTETTIDDFVLTNKYTDIYSLEEYYNNPENLLDLILPENN